MNESRVTARITVIGLLLVLLIGAFSPMVQGKQTTPLLTVHFLDVGQGDAILIESPSGQQLLVDGGRGPAVLSGLSSTMGWLDRSIDVVLATHLDADHVGGLVDVLDRYEVAHIVTQSHAIDTDIGKAFQVAVSREGAQVQAVVTGYAIDLGEGVIVEVLSPLEDIKGLERNAASIVVQVRYGTTEFLLTGDAPKMVEEYLVESFGTTLSSDVLKVGHHGSRTSTSELFLTTVSPDFAVISAGADNRYGHPHVEVTDALFNAGVETLQTAEEGTMTFFSDGTTVWLE